MLILSFTIHGAVIILDRRP